MYPARTKINADPDPQHRVFFDKFILAQGGKAEAGEDAASYNLGKNYRNSVRRDADKVCSLLFRCFSGFSFYSYFHSLVLLYSLVPDCLSFFFFLPSFVSLHSVLFLFLTDIENVPPFSSFSPVFSLLSYSPSSYHCLCFLSASFKWSAFISSLDPALVPKEKFNYLRILAKFLKSNKLENLGNVLGP